MVLKIKKDYQVNMWMGVNHGTNTRAEIMALGGSYGFPIKEAFSISIYLVIQELSLIGLQDLHLSNLSFLNIGLQKLMI